MITEIPHKTHLTFKAGTHKINQKKLKQYVIPHYIKEDLYDLNIEQEESFYHNPIKIYSPERSLVDVWRSNEDPAVQIEGLNGYVQSKYFNLADLTETMNKFSGISKLKAAMEVIIN